MLFNNTRNNTGSNNEARSEQQEKSNELTVSCVATTGRRSKRLTRHDPISISVDLSTSRDVMYVPTFPSPLPHLKGKQQTHYMNVVPVEDLDLFQVALELFNRKGVRPVKMETSEELGASDICQYFFVCVGKAKVSTKFCTECRDMKKNRKRYDFYYIDVAEIARERSVRCSTCMYFLLKKHIFGAEDAVRQELRFLRVLQPSGILVDPYLLSCGY